MLHVKRSTELEATEGCVLKSSNSTLGDWRHPWQTSARTSPFQRHSESAKNKTSSPEQAISLCSSFNQVVALVDICFLKNKIYKQPPVRVREMQEGGCVQEGECDLLFLDRSI